MFKNKGLNLFMDGCENFSTAAVLSAPKMTDGF